MEIAGHILGKTDVILKKFYYLLYGLLKPKSKLHFISSQSDYCDVLDVGCGNGSVVNFKSILPNCIYTGIDIADYNQTQYSIQLMDKYHLVPPSIFPSKINELQIKFDVIICSHNLEHCNDRKETLLAIVNALKIGGSLYLSFPSEESTNFPSRYGTLNYYDDATHTDNPPVLNDVLSILKENGLEVTFKQKRYQPKILYIVGFLSEWYSNWKKKIVYGTWEYYGFETIIHAKKSTKLENY